MAGTEPDGAVRKELETLEAYNVFFGGDKVQAFIQWAREHADALYPDVGMRTYVVPPLFVHKHSMRFNATAGADVMQETQKSSPKGEKAHSLVARSFGLLSPRLARPLFVISGLEYDNLLKWVRTHDHLAPALPASVENRGDIDIMLIHPCHGVVFVQVKAVGDNPESFNQTEVEKKILLGARQIHKDENVLRWVLKDWPDVTSCRVTGVVALPNLSRDQLASFWPPPGDGGLDPSSEEGKYMDGVVFLCKDDLPSPAHPAMPEADTDVTSLMTWWNKHVACVDGTLPLPFMKDMVSRYVGLLSAVEVYAGNNLRQEVRTTQEAVAVCGMMFRRILLNQQQLRILTSPCARRYLSGPPGSGKTVLLMLRGRRFVRTGGHVIVVNMYRGAPGRAIGHFIREGVARFCLPSDTKKKKPKAKKKKADDPITDEAASMANEITPSEEAPHGTPPVKKNAHGTPPVARKAQGTPPVERKTHGTPPVERKPHGTPPVEKKARGTPPVDRKNQGTPPVGRKAQGTPLVERKTQGTPPVERKAQGTPPVERKNHGTPPLERKSQRTPTMDRKTHGGGGTPPMTITAHGTPPGNRKSPRGTPPVTTKAHHGPQSGDGQARRGTPPMAIPKAHGGSSSTSSSSTSPSSSSSPRKRFGTPPPPPSSSSSPSSSSRARIPGSPPPPSSSSSPSSPSSSSSGVKTLGSPPPSSQSPKRKPHHPPSHQHPDNATQEVDHSARVHSVDVDIDARAFDGARFQADIRQWLPADVSPDDVMFIVDEIYVREYWSGILEAIDAGFPGCHVWCAGLYSRNPPGFQQEDLTTVLRCPPLVQKVLHAVDWDEGRKKCYRLNTDTADVYTPGLTPLVVRHQSHRQVSVTECEQCARELSALLTDGLGLRLDGGDTVTSFSSSASSDVTPPAPAAGSAVGCSDVIMLANIPRQLYEPDPRGFLDTTRGDFQHYMAYLSACPLVAALRGHGVPVKVIEELPCWELYDAQAARRQVSLAWAYAFQGLERQVVIYLPGDTPSTAPGHAHLPGDTPCTTLDHAHASENTPPTATDPSLVHTPHPPGDTPSTTHGHAHLSGDTPPAAPGPAHPRIEIPAPGLSSASRTHPRLWQPVTAEKLAGLEEGGGGKVGGEGWGGGRGSGGRGRGDGGGDEGGERGDRGGVGGGVGRGDGGELGGQGRVEDGRGKDGERDGEGGEGGDANGGGVGRKGGERRKADGEEPKEREAEGGRGEVEERREGEDGGRDEGRRRGDAGKRERMTVEGEGEPLVSDSGKRPTQTNFNTCENSNPRSDNKGEPMTSTRLSACHDPTGFREEEEALMPHLSHSKCDTSDRSSPGSKESSVQHVPRERPHEQDRCVISVSKPRSEDLESPDGNESGSQEIPGCRSRSRSKESSGCVLRTGNPCEHCVSEKESPGDDDDDDDRSGSQEMPGCRSRLRSRSGVRLSDHWWREQDVARYSQWDRSNLFVAGSRCLSQLVMIIP